MVGLHSLFYTLVNIKIISKFVGHSDIKTTMRYITPTDEDIMMNLVR